MAVEVRLLGTGTSYGIPIIACTCPVCRSSDPKDKRLRCSLLLRSPLSSIIVDVGPEFRIQALSAQLTRLDLVLLTHPHADHCAGIDDLRPFCSSSPLPIFGDRPCLRQVRQRFAYAFAKETTQSKSTMPKLRLKTFPKAGLQHNEFFIRAITVQHGDAEILAWRFDIEDGPSLAYVSDCSFLSDTAYTQLGDLDLFFIDGLTNKKHPTHFSYNEAIEASLRIQARQTRLIHMAHSLSHAELENYCRERSKGQEILPGFDGENFLFE